MTEPDINPDRRLTGAHPRRQQETGVGPPPRQIDHGNTPDRRRQRLTAAAGHHLRMNAARVLVQFSVEDLWFRYLGLTGTCDLIDIDGHLRGVLSLDTHQETVLAHTLNEALQDLYDAYAIPFP